jgi:hypothetical protein
MIYIKCKDGHREFGANTISLITGDRDIVSQINARALQCAKLRFATIDDNIYLFFVVAFIRNLFGKKTSGLLFSPWTAFKKKSIKALLKRLVLKFFKKCKHITVICYVPYYLDERYELISEDWIYDLEFWDLMLSDRKSLVPTQPKNSKEEATIYFLGAIAFRKGINLLSFLKQSLDKNGWAGRLEIKGAVGDDPQRISNSLYSLRDCIEDKYLSDSEFIDFASKGTHLWCCYEPSYNSSSGIFGRALQLGKVPIIRRGSIIDRICQYENIDCIRLDYQLTIEVSQSFLRLLKEKKSPAAANSKFVQKAYFKSFKIIQEKL